MSAKEQVDAMLAQCGATLLRDKKHEVWLLPNGQKFTRAHTPSDCLADSNSLSNLKHALGITKTVAVVGERRARKSTNGKAVARPRFVPAVNNTLADKLRLNGVSEAALRERIQVLESSLVGRTERQNYLKHIRRLQLENKVLRSVVAQERLRRQAAYGWYFSKLRSRWMWMVDYMVMSFRHGAR